MLFSRSQIVLYLLDLHAVILLCFIFALGDENIDQEARLDIFLALRRRKEFVQNNHFINELIKSLRSTAHVNLSFAPATTTRNNGQNNKFEIIIDRPLAAL